MTVQFSGIVPSLRAWFRRHPVVYYGALALAVVTLWSAVYGRFPGTRAFRVPVEYQGDALFVIGVLRGFSEFPAPWNLQITHLNAPFGADWNDYPHSEKLLFYFGGTLTRLFDAGAALNLFLMFAFVLNAIGFCWTARRFGAGLVTAAAGSIIFAFSTYALFRGAPHILLVYAGHVPLLFYLCRRLQHIGERRRPLWIWGSIYVVGSAFLNPYYFIFALLLVSLTSMRLLVRRRFRDALMAVVFLAEGGLAFVANQLNVILYRGSHGANPLIHPRLLTEQVRWGLRLPDLFMPLDHPFKAWTTFAQQHYFIPEFVSENAAAFLGLVGCLGLVALVLVSLAQAMRARTERVPYEVWIILLAYLFGASGGGALLTAVGGFSWLRGTNRYSIVILCAVLLWGGRVFKFRGRPLLGAALCMVLAAFTVWESSFAWPRARRQPQTAQVENDRAFVRALERQLPREAAVFQLPVMGFPEVPPIAGLLDNDPFRPFLWSRQNLRFSYGTHRGRARESWQALCAQKAAQDMASELKAKGFAAILIHRPGYKDRGHALEASLAALGLQRIAGGPEGDMVSYQLR